MKSPLAASFGALLLLAGCSGQPQSEAKTPETKTAVDEKKLPDTGGGEPIELSAIEKGELLRLDGDHECSFTIKGQSGPALVAKADTGDDELASGAYKIGGKVLRVAGSGGFKALEKGMELSGPGMKLAVKPAEGSEVATLTAQRTYGGERSYEGAWACKA
ncbi:hypothetical protein [Sphingopyxis sp. NJF-3]|jgi:hypothetical protein